VKKLKKNLLCFFLNFHKQYQLKNRMTTQTKIQNEIINAIQDIHYMDAENISNIIVDYDDYHPQAYWDSLAREEKDKEEDAKYGEINDIRARQIYRKKIYKTLPLDMWKGRSKLARFINHCGGWRIREFSCEDDEYRAIRFVIHFYNDISKADLKIHGDKWLYQFATEFGIYDY